MLARIRKAMEEREEGFTLIELLVVIIIGILAAIAIPVFLRQRENGWKAAMKSDARNAATAEEAYATDNNGSYDTTGGPYDKTTNGTTTDLPNEGLNVSDTDTVTVTAGSVNNDQYCIDVTSTHFPNTSNFYHVWYTNAGTNSGVPYLQEASADPTPNGC